MAVRVEPFTPDRVSAVSAFNHRLASGGAGWKFPEDPVPDWLPPEPGSKVYQEYYLLLEGDVVRGAYILKHRDVSLRGDIRSLATIELPVSEGTINGAYAMVGYQLVSDALRKQPFMLGVGLGGQDVRIARVMRALGWQIRPVPFYFKALHGTRFFRHLRYARTTRLRALAMDAAAFSGIAELGVKTAGLRGRRPPLPTRARAEMVPEFGSWADEIWQLCSGRSSFVGVRDSDSLNRIYLPSNPHVTRLKITLPGQVLGFAVIEDRQLSDSDYFGDLRVGTIMDGLALPAHVASVTWHATRALQDLGVDLIVSNQSHPAWCAGLRRAGFLTGPTNFYFASAPQLTRLLADIDANFREIHFNRGDGPGPWGVTWRLPGENEAAPGRRKAATGSGIESRPGVLRTLSQ
jgi:hypothetical protein